MALGNNAKATHANSVALGTNPGSRLHLDYVEPQLQHDGSLRAASMFKQYLQVTKPGIIFGNLISVIGGFLLASKGSIDSRQHQHLMQAWTIVRKAGYVPDSVPLEHHMFGMMLGKDGKPFKTRAAESGGGKRQTAIFFRISRDCFIPAQNEEKVAARRRLGCY
jgi:hypothetical protein